MPQVHPYPKLPYIQFTCMQGSSACNNHDNFFSFSVCTCTCSDGLPPLPTDEQITCITGDLLSLFSSCFGVNIDMTDVSGVV